MYQLILTGTAYTQRIHIIYALCIYRAASQCSQQEGPFGFCALSRLTVVGRERLFEMPRRFGGTCVTGNIPRQ